MEAGFVAFRPRGAYYILTEAEHFLKRSAARTTTSSPSTCPGGRGATVRARPSTPTASSGGPGSASAPKTDDMLIEAGRRLQKLAR